MRSPLRALPASAADVATSRAVTYIWITFVVVCLWLTCCIRRQCPKEWISKRSAYDGISGGHSRWRGPVNCKNRPIIYRERLISSWKLSAPCPFKQLNCAPGTEVNANTTKLLSLLDTIGADLSMFFERATYVMTRWSEKHGYGKINRPTVWGG